ncbi:hypothetical protein ACFZCL_30970 [Streptomyces sp. NPDC008159]|uniref:hypothetical protein n=1 Tax=Streptomyces sp. NPDC008159 TaxID=3364817 RepID=UPI0036E7FD4D
MSRSVPRFPSRGSRFAPHRPYPDAITGIQHLYKAVAWREAPFSTDEQRAALALAEAATRIQDGAPGVTDEVWDAAADHFSEEELGAITQDVVGLGHALAAWRRYPVVQSWQIYFVARYMLDT